MATSESEEPDLVAGPDRIGWALVSLPVLAAGATAVLPMAFVEWVTVAMVVASFVLASIDAQRLRAGWLPTLVLLALWFVGYPYWLHRRARYGTVRFLPLGLAAMLIWGLVVGARLL